MDRVYWFIYSTASSNVLVCNCNRVWCQTTLSGKLHSMSWRTHKAPPCALFILLFILLPLHHFTTILPPTRALPHPPSPTAEIYSVSPGRSVSHAGGGGHSLNPGSTNSFAFNLSRLGRETAPTCTPGSQSLLPYLRIEPDTPRRRREKRKKKNYRRKTATARHSIPDPPRPPPEFSLYHPLLARPRVTFAQIQFHRNPGLPNVLCINKLCHIEKYTTEEPQAESTKVREQ